MSGVGRIQAVVEEMDRQGLIFGIASGQNLASVLAEGNTADRQIVWQDSLGPITHLIGPSDQPFVVQPGSGQVMVFRGGSGTTAFQVDEGGTLVPAGRALSFGGDTRLLRSGVSALVVDDAAGGAATLSVPGTGANSEQYGPSADAAGDSCVAVGPGCVAGGATEIETTAMGRLTLMTGAACTGVGQAADDGGFDNCALYGWHATGTGGGASVFGQGGAAADFGTALGVQGTAVGSSTALGAFAVSTASGQFVAGSNGIPVTNRRLVSSSGSEHRLRFATELLATPAGASVTTAGLIPAGVRLLYVMARVTTTITGATTFDVGDGTDVDRFGAAIVLPVDTEVDNTDATADPGGFATGAQEVTLTANGADFTAGAVRIVAVYEEVGAPTA